MRRSWRAPRPPPARWCSCRRSAATRRSRCPARRPPPAGSNGAPAGGREVLRRKPRRRRPRRTCATAQDQATHQTRYPTTILVTRTSQSPHSAARSLSSRSSGWSSNQLTSSLVGLLIHAAVGSAGSVGGRRTHPLRRRGVGGIEDAREHRSTTSRYTTSPQSSPRSFGATPPGGGGLRVIAVLVAFACSTPPRGRAGRERAWPALRPARERHSGGRGAGWPRRRAAAVFGEAQVPSATSGCVPVWTSSRCDGARQDEMLAFEQRTVRHIGRLLGSS